MTIDLCNLLKGALCPLPMYNFTSADSIQLPSSINLAQKIPNIAFKIPDLEGFVQLTLTEVTTGRVKACVQATLSNGWSARQAAVTWTTAILALLTFLAAGAFSISSPKAILPFRLLELVYLSIHCNQRLTRSQLSFDLSEFRTQLRLGIRSHIICRITGSGRDCANAAFDGGTDVRYQRRRCSQT